MVGGYIYEKKDERDYPICMAYEDAEDIVLPESFQTSFQPPYANQKSTGNCVAQSLANIAEVIWYKQTGEHRDFSVGFRYGDRKPNQTQKEGMTGYMACDNFCENGDVLASVFESNSEVPDIIKEVNAFKEQTPNWRELAYTPDSYIRTRSEKEAMRFMYKYDIPVMACCDVKHFWLGSGYHAMAMYGWEGKTAILQNSWGENSINKIVKMPADKIIDFWLIKPFNVAKFNDLDMAHWAYKDVVKCVTKNILLGYPDGSFRPEKNMTRAEAAAMIYRTLKGENNS